MKLREAKSIYREIKKLEAQADALWAKARQLTANSGKKFSPVQPGDIVVTRDESNRLNYFKVNSIDGGVDRKKKIIVPFAHGFRCTSTGARRGGWSILGPSKIASAERVIKATS